MTMRLSLMTALILIMGWIACPAGADVSFVHDIAPIVLKRCTGCHGERTNLGGYRAHTFQSLMKVGASGNAPIVAGKPAESRLFQLISAKIALVRMPKSDDPLSPDQIEKFRQWIQQGAKFDGLDAAVPLKNLLGPRQHPATPAVYRVAVPVMAIAFPDLPGKRAVMFFIMMKPSGVVDLNGSCITSQPQPFSWLTM